MNFRKIQNLICIIVVGVIVLVWVFSGQFPSSSFASKNISSKMDKQIIILDAGQGAYALTIVA